MQVTFNPVDFGFTWTDDWYLFDDDLCHSRAREARDFAFKDLKSQGKNPKRFTMHNQLIKRGGIGTGKPEIEVFVTVYGINADD